MSDMREVSKSELLTVKWVEYVFAPLMVILIVSLGTCSLGAQEDMIQLKQTVNVLTKAAQDRTENVEDIMRIQSEVAVKIGKIETSQEALKIQIQDLKEQNKEVLTILRQRMN